MAVKITDVKITPQEVTVGETITIVVSAVDVTWEIIKQDFETWNDIKTELSNWKALLNHH